MTMKNNALTPSILFARSMRYGTDLPPHNPTPADRYNEYRAKVNTVPVNNHPWKHLRHDPNPPTADEVAEAFRFK